LRLEGVAARDLDGNGLVDIVAVSALDTTLRIVEYGADGRLRLRPDGYFLPDRADARSLMVEDLDGDGRLDLSLPSTAGGVFLYRQRPAR
jgi:hypothetical protein